MVGGSPCQQSSGGAIVHAAWTGQCGTTRSVPRWSPSSRNQLPSIHLQVFLTQQGLAGASLHFASVSFLFELTVAEKPMNFSSGGFSLSCDFGLCDCVGHPLF